MKSKYWFTDKDLVRWFFVDSLYRSPIKKIIAFFMFAAGMALQTVACKRRAFGLFMSAHRWHPNSLYLSRVMKGVSTIPGIFSMYMRDDIDIDNASSRSIIVKMPECSGDHINKGVIIITFTDTFRYYFYNIDIESLQDYFHIVLEPSWAGYCLPEILFWTLYASPVFVQATEITDRIFIKEIESNLVALDFGASDWVNYNTFYPLPLDKVYDSIYVANYSHVKRLHVYFKALRDIKKRNVAHKGAIVCARWGDDRETVHKFIEIYDIADVLDVHESLNAEEVNRVLNQSRCNMLLSLKEGSNRSLFESMFCDVPAIMLKGNVGANKSYINDQTGMLIEENDLAESLIRMKYEHERFNSREWAMSNISPEVTTRKLVDAIHTADTDFSPELGRVMVKTNEPEVAYLVNPGNIDSKYYMAEVLKIFRNGSESSDAEAKIVKLSQEFYRYIT